MSTTIVPTPTSRLQFGLARVDITPPVGIYHPLWGAARHTRSTGVHRPLTAEVMAFGPLDAGPTPHFIRVQLDLPGLVRSQHGALQAGLSQVSGLPTDSIILSYSHTHAAGWFVPDRIAMPGGELIEPYIESLNTKLQQACREALNHIQPVTIAYATGRCNLAANRDYRDEDGQFYACGFNPDAPADETVVVARITGADGNLQAVVVNYGCHPTTLAWDNTLISPDYIGAMRETVERATGATGIFALGACGDLAPHEGYVGDTAVADRNGRQLGYAALSTLESLIQPNTDFYYAGPVVSGATLGAWAARPQDQVRQAETTRFAGGSYTVDLPLRAKPDRAALEQDLRMWLERQQAADAAGNAAEARDCGAHAERARRWLSRLKDIPDGQTFAFGYTVYRLGDAIWVTTGGEPYNILQVELRRRFPNQPILFSPVAGDLQVAYLLPADRYGQGLYQEEPSILAQGCLEILTEAIAGRIAALLED